METYVNFVDLVNSFPTRIFCKNWRRYCRERASQRLEVIQSIYSFASLELTERDVERTGLRPVTARGEPTLAQWHLMTNELNSLKDFAAARVCRVFNDFCIDTFDSAIV